MEISIIMPVYNSEKYLSACLESVFHQSFQDFELICINDGSTDRSLDILNQYAEKYYEANNISYFTILVNYMTKEERQEWLKRAQTDKKTNFVAVLSE